MGFTSQVLYHIGSTSGGIRAGYVLANTGTMYWLWCPFMLAWIIKTLIIRYGGIKGYRTALPFFLGLVLGDYIASSRALAGSVLGITMYRCFPC